MDQSGGLYQMSVQQDICPAPNEGPKAVDWLPLFAGFSWLAYGAHFTVVITMAPDPSNTGEAAMGGFFQQALSTDWPKEAKRVAKWVSSVGWAPFGHSIGSLAASSGSQIYLYGPKGLNSLEEGSEGKPEVPLRWVNTHVLEHSSDVLSFAWSESGDGLLSVGLEIVMWQKAEDCWNCLWRVQLDQPHSLSSASWSARGIAASAAGTVDSVKAKQDDADHLVKIWWWEDGKELLEIELSHPEQLLMVQWRPMRGFGPSDQSFRPVLLTCCRDGVVRLWAEIGNLGFPESRNSNFSTTAPTDLLSDGQEAQFKLAFFVSAVIDVNSVLKGVLGHDIHVAWPEARGGGLRSSSSRKDDGTGLVSKENELAISEWLIAIGPSGSIALWSVQSLDDLSPARGPLLQLSHQRSGLLPPPGAQPLEGNADINTQRRLQAVKVVVHKPHGTLLGPPYSMDVFETWSPHLLRWSSIWPPVAAIGGPTSKAMASNSGASSTVATGGKLSAWGISSEIVCLGGHSGTIVQIAVHPVAVIGLVASLDSNGMVLVWDSSGSSSNPRLEITGCLNPLWKLSGQLTGLRVNCANPFNSMAWAPDALEGNDAVLLVGHSFGVDCHLISRKLCVSKGKPKSLQVVHKLLCTLDWPSSSNEVGLEGIYSLLSCTAIRENPNVGCIAVGVGASGLKLVSWKLDIEVDCNRKSSQLSSQDLQGSTGPAELNVTGGPSKDCGNVVEEFSVDDGGSLKNGQTREGEGQYLMMKSQLIGFSNLFKGEQVTAIATATSEHLSWMPLESHNHYTEVCDVVTGCADGSVRLWKIWDDSSRSPFDSLEKSVGWQCIGLLRSYMGPVTKVALCNGGSKVATVGSTLDGTDESLRIWGADTFIEERGFCLEGQVLLSSSAVSIGWLDSGNGLFVLGVAVQSTVQLFAQSRVPVLLLDGGSSSGLADCNVWTCLASSSLTSFKYSSLSWETRGSLVMSCEGHILIHSNYVVPLASGGLCTSASSRGSDKSQDLIVGNSNSLNLLEPLPPVNDSYLENALRLDEVDDSNSNRGKEVCSIMEAAEKIGCPLLDYHPTSILCWISGGSRHCARASIRHLASSLIPLSNSSSLDRGFHKNILSTDYRFSKARISRTPLGNLFQGREEFAFRGGQNTTASFASEEIGKVEVGRIQDYSPTLSREYFKDFSTSFGSDYRKDAHSLVIEHSPLDKNGGFEPFTKVEIESISNLVRDNLKIPGLSGDEKRQLLAIIDVLAEMDGVKQPSQIDSIDLPGQRFWLAVRFSFLHTRWTKQRSPHLKELVIGSKAIAWALQSEFKETVLDLCLLDQTPSWSAIRALGIGYWFTNGAELRNRVVNPGLLVYVKIGLKQICASNHQIILSEKVLGFADVHLPKMEKVARAQYMEKKDPKDCALIYLALDRRSVLAGLFKLSRDQRDRPLADFLLRDFKDEKNQTAALKNAYVLMGQHRHELAAAFFILGGDSNSAAVVCAKNLGDFQLALVVSSLLEGTNGPIGRNIILKYALPMAREAGDGWLASLLQWLLGNGIESLQELSPGTRELLTSVTERAKDSWEGLNQAVTFALEYDVGSYCELLASKPRLRVGADAVEASALARIAMTRSAAALHISGLPLQALECLKTTQSVNPYKLGGEFNSNGSSSTPNTSVTPSSDVPLTDIIGREVGLGWVSMDVVTGLQRATLLSLVLQTASQLLQDHPQWGTTWQDPWTLEGMLKQKKNLNKVGGLNEPNERGATLDRSENEKFILYTSDGADKLCDHELQLLTRKYVVKIDKIAAALGTFSGIHHRFYLCHQLIQGWHSFRKSPEIGLFLPGKAAISASATHTLEALGTEAPWVLSRAILACGGAAAGLELSNLEVSQTNWIQWPVGDHSHAESGALQWFQIEELVRVGGELQFLRSAASQEENSLFDKNRGSQAMMLLSFIFFVAAAWLGRQTKTLLALIAPTVINPSAAPDVPHEEFDAVTWFRTLNMVQSSLVSSVGKKVSKDVAFNPGGRVTISADDAWRVLGVTLWTHILIYVKNQLTGMASDVAYSSFGHMLPSQARSSMKTSFQSISSQSQQSMTSNTKGPTFLGFNLPSSALSSTWTDLKSKVRDGYHVQQSVTVANNSIGSAEGGPKDGKSSLSEGSLSSPKDIDDFGAALLSSLTSIVAGLRKQLAAHLRYSLNKSDTGPLTLWLWGKPSFISAKKAIGGGNALNFFGASSSGQRVPAASTTNVYSRPGPNLFPTADIKIEDEGWKELWELLVVREQVCSALGLEGVSGQRLSKQEENENMSEWYLGRKGHFLATQIDLIGAARQVTATGKHPPKRIMWNAVKGGPPIPDRGVTLSSQRKEENEKSTSRVSKDGLHLSEEFTEAGIFAFGDTFMLK